METVIVPAVPPFNEKLVRRFRAKLHIPIEDPTKDNGQYKIVSWGLNHVPVRVFSCKGLCWPFVGKGSLEQPKSRNDKNYGIIKVGKEEMRAHIFAWIVAHPGEVIHKGEKIDHLCHDPNACKLPEVQPNDCPHRACCRPEHLKKVTNRTNVALSRSNKSRVEKGNTALEIVEPEDQMVLLFKVLLLDKLLRYQRSIQPPGNIQYWQGRRPQNIESTIGEVHNPWQVGDWVEGRCSWTVCQAPVRRVVLAIAPSGKPLTQLFDDGGSNHGGLHIKTCTGAHRRY